MAGLQNAIEELDKQAGEEAPEVEEELEEETEAPEPAIPQPAPEIAPQPVSEAPKVETAPIDNNGWAKLRWEAAESRREAERLKAENEALKKPKVITPDKNEDFAAYADHEIGATKSELSEIKEKLINIEQKEQNKRVRDAAWDDFTTRENQFKAVTPDYEDVGSFGVNVIASSLRVLNPAMSNKELGETVQELILQKAAAYERQGLNPVQALYQEARAYGYQPKTAQNQDHITTEAPRPNLGKVAENKKKSSGMSNTGGNGQSTPTNDVVLNMTNAERMKLTESDWERLERESA